MNDDLDSRTEKVGKAKKTIGTSFPFFTGEAPQKTVKVRRTSGTIILRFAPAPSSWQKVAVVFTERSEDDDQITITNLPLVPTDNCRPRCRYRLWIRQSIVFQTKGKTWVIACTLRRESSWSLRKTGRCTEKES